MQNLNELLSETKKIITRNSTKCINKILAVKNKIIVKCKNESDVGEIKNLVSS